MRKHFATIVIILLVNICQAQPFTEARIEKAKQQAYKNIENYLIETDEYFLQLKGSKYAITDKDLKPLTDFKYSQVRSGIKGGFVVKNSSGYHILDHNLKRITPKNYNKIWILDAADQGVGEDDKYYELKIGSKSEYMVFNEQTGKFRFEKFMESESFILPPYAIASNFKSSIKPINKTRDKYLPKEIATFTIGNHIQSDFKIVSKGKKTMVSQNGALVLKTKMQVSTFGNLIFESNKSTESSNLMDNRGELVLTECGDIFYYDTLLFVHHKASPENLVSVFGKSGKMLFTIQAKSIEVHEYRHSSRIFRYLHVHQNNKSAIVNLDGLVVFQGNENQSITVQNHYIRDSGTYPEKFGYLYEMDKPIRADYNDLIIQQNIICSEKNDLLEVYDRNQNLILSGVEFSSIVLSEKTEKLLILKDEDNSYIISPGQSKVILKTAYKLVNVEVTNTSEYLIIYSEGLYGAIMLDNLKEIPPIYHIVYPVDANKSFLVLNDKLKLGYVRYDGTELFD